MLGFVLSPEHQNLFEKHLPKMEDLWNLTPPHLSGERICGKGKKRKEKGFFLEEEC